MILIKLILAHIIGDFFLQPKKWLLDKEEKIWRSKYLYLHVAIHFILVLGIFWDASLWPAALTIMASHFFVDGCKLSFQNEKSKGLWFGIDQAAHLAVLVIVWIVFWRGVGFKMAELSDQFWVLLTSVLFLTFPSSYIMQYLMQPWSDQVDTAQTESLTGAGRYIGMLERVFVYIAVITGNAQIIGFLLAAKSVFRFGDLTRSKALKLTEYVLIGTLFSFLLAIVVGFLSTKLNGA